MAAAAVACGTDEAGAERTAAIARAHEEDLVAFDAWARRIAASDTSFGSRAALEEAAFAPIRGQREIAGAWIERRGPDPQLLAHPPRAVVPELVWRRTRAPALGEVEVGVHEGREYVRRASDAPAGGTLVVTMSFAAEARP